MWPLILGVAAAAREEVNFDFAWRHQIGDPKQQAGLPAAAATDFDDSGWELVDTPHDMLIVGKHSPDNDPKKVLQKVAQGTFEFPSPWWDDISANAKDLVVNLLQMDPQKRYTTQQALAHPWIARRRRASVEPITFSPEMFQRYRASAADKRKRGVSSPEPPGDIF